MADDGVPTGGLERVLALDREERREARPELAHGRAGDPGPESRGRAPEPAEELRRGERPAPHPSAPGGDTGDRERQECEREHGHRVALGAAHLLTARRPRHAERDAGGAPDREQRERARGRGERGEPSEPPGEQSRFEREYPERAQEHERERGAIGHAAEDSIRLTPRSAWPMLPWPATPHFRRPPCRSRSSVPCTRSSSTPRS